MSDQVWREPAEESIDLYPGLVVHDGRHSGSITFGRTRLPVSAVIADLIYGGWEDADRNYDIERCNGWGEREMVAFLVHLLEARGEFARLLLEIANADLSECDGHGDNIAEPWWRDSAIRSRVLAQLERCADALRVEAGR